MTLADDLDRVAAAAAALARDGERVTAVLPAEPHAAARAYLCAFEGGAGGRSWLVVDAAARPVSARTAVRDVVTVTALCEIAAERATLGDLDELRAQLVALRLTEAPAGLDEAEAAVAGLLQTIGVPPQLASPARLDEIGAAVRRLELALDPTAASPFATAMQSAQGAVDEIVRDVESNYRLQLD